jgi:hypothetical protein
MRTVRKVLLGTTFASLVGLAVAHPALAAPIAGSDTVGASVLSSNETGGNLGTSTTFTLASANETFSVLATGVGSFSAITIGTTVPLTSALLDLSNLASFGFTSATVGTFTPTMLNAYNQTSTSLNLFITGGFTPGSLFGAGATAPLGASENLGFTQTNGGVISFSGTFASPPEARPTGIPEPLTIALFGAGLAGVVTLRRRRKVNKVA